MQHAFVANSGGDAAEKAADWLWRSRAHVIADIGCDVQQCHIHIDVICMLHTLVECDTDCTDGAKGGIKQRSATTSA